jgi:hypothetical protein
MYPNKSRDLFTLPRLLAVIVLISVNEGPDRYKLGPSFENWEPGMSTEPIQCFPGEWGPPLESIEQPVREWWEHV